MSLLQLKFSKLAKTKSNFTLKKNKNDKISQEYDVIINQDGTI